MLLMLDCFGTLLWQTEAIPGAIASNALASALLLWLKMRSKARSEHRVCNVLVEMTCFFLSGLPS